MHGLSLSSSTFTGWAQSKFVACENTVGGGSLIITPSGPCSDRNDIFSTNVRVKNKASPSKWMQIHSRSFIEGWIFHQEINGDLPCTAGLMWYTPAWWCTYPTFSPPTLPRCKQQLTCAVLTTQVRLQKSAKSHYLLSGIWKGPFQTGERETGLGGFRHGRRIKNVKTPHRSPLILPFTSNPITLPVWQGKCIQMCTCVLMRADVYINDILLHIQLQRCVVIYSELRVFNPYLWLNIV